MLYLNIRSRDKMRRNREKNKSGKIWMIKQNKNKDLLVYYR